MISSLQTQNQFKTDLLGVIASGLCIVHCMMTPLLFVAQAGLSTQHSPNATWWGVIDVVLLLLSLAAVMMAAKKTSMRWMKAALLTCWLFLALFIANEKWGTIHIAENWIYLPSLSLIALHITNTRYSKCDDETCHVHLTGNTE